ncbi:hypothetical protein C8Q78DRAFT_1024590 [Trametes maxima]|nr:hypothetical protein C8Q78DRAFT_1024590 [Trametes maxima]
MDSSRQRLLDIARSAINIFARRGLKCCLVGSVASYAYGVPRVPKDVDLVVLTTHYDQETLKEMLVAADSRFYLVPSRKLFATYKVLWYRSDLGYYGSRYKVDILLPGIMNIPNVPHQHVVYKAPHNLPLMPLIPHLLLKLQAWDDHRLSARNDFLAKMPTDRSDIDQLLAIVCRSGERVDSLTLRWLPESMLTAARARLGKYLMYGSWQTKPQWKSLGFNV